MFLLFNFSSGLSRRARHRSVEGGSKRGATGEILAPSLDCAVAGAQPNTLSRGRQSAKVSKRLPIRAFAGAVAKALTDAGIAYTSAPPVLSPRYIRNSAIRTVTVCGGLAQLTMMSSPGSLQSVTA